MLRYEFHNNNSLYFSWTSHVGLSVEGSTNACTLPKCVICVDLFMQVHVNLLLMEARLQAALLYALRAITRYMT